MAVKKTQKIYEFCFHIDPETSDKDVNNLLSSIEKKIEAVSGEIISKQDPEHIELAYPIKSKTRDTNGVYLRFTNSIISSIKFQIQTELQKTLEDDFSGIKEIFRSIFFESDRPDIVFDTEEENEKEVKEEVKEKEKVN